MKATISLFAVLFIFGASCFAQDKKVVEPDWVLTVTTSGGFGGAGKGNFQVTSLGQAFRVLRAPAEINLGDCSISPTQPAVAQFVRQAELPPLKTELFNSLTMAIDALPNFEVLRRQLKESQKEKPEISTADVCSDCYQTTIHLLRREPDGKISTFKIHLSDVRNQEQLTRLTKITDEILDVLPEQ